MNERSALAAEKEGRPAKDASRVAIVITILWVAIGGGFALSALRGSGAPIVWLATFGGLGTALGALYALLALRLRPAGWLLMFSAVCMPTYAAAFVNLMPLVLAVILLRRARRDATTGD